MLAAENVREHHYGFNADGTPMPPSDLTPLKKYGSGMVRTVRQDENDQHYVVTYDYSDSRY